jgi:hypothetical protein
MFAIALAATLAALPDGREFYLCHPELVEGSASRLLLDVQALRERCFPRQARDDKAGH